MFAILDLSVDSRGITLKCDPELAVELREKYPQVVAAWHFNKTHWNGVSLGEGLTDDLLKSWIDHSYQIIFDSLPLKERREIESG